VPAVAFAGVLSFLVGGLEDAALVVGLPVGMTLRSDDDLVETVDGAAVGLCRDYLSSEMFLVNVLKSFVILGRCASS
jgi:hypothetical protein